MEGRVFYKLIVFDAAMLLVYTIADLFVWATVASIPFVTRVFWSPVTFQVDFHFSSGAYGSINSTNESFTSFIFVMVIDLLLARVGTRKYSVASVLLLGLYALNNDTQYSNLVNFISSFQTNLTWNHLFIAVGNSVTIITSLTLLVVLVMTVVNIVYAQRNANSTFTTQTGKQGKSL